MGDMKNYVNIVSFGQRNYTRLYKHSLYAKEILWKAHNVKQPWCKEIVE